MTPILYRIPSAKLTPFRGGLDSPVPDLYELKLEGRDPTALWPVHVPESIRTVFENDEVAWVAVEPLEGSPYGYRNSLGDANYVVLAVKTKAGVFHESTSPTLERARRKVLAVGTGLALAGITMLSLTTGLFIWVGAVACVVGSHWLRTGFKIPRPPGHDVFSPSRVELAPTTQ